MTTKTTLATTKAVRRLLSECPECGNHLPPGSELGYGCTHCVAKKIAKIVWDEAVKKSGGFVNVPEGKS